MPSAATAHYVHFLVQYSSIALLYYDYVLTLGSEVKFIWRGKFRISTMLYAFCRYALIANVVYLLAIAKKLTHKNVSGCNSCDAWYKFVAAISLLGRASVIFVLGARTYAVFNCNRYVLAVIGTLALTCIGLSIVHVPGAKCVGANDNVKYSLLRGALASNANAILTAFYETLVAVLTLFRALQEHRVNKSTKGSDHGLLSLLIDQGIVYFCITSAFTITTIVLNFTQTSGTFFSRLLNAITLPLSCLLTARFLLQLREWQEKDTSGSTSLYMNPTRTLPTPNFAANFDAILLDDFGNNDQVTGISLQEETTSIRPLDTNTQPEANLPQY